MKKWLSVFICCVLSVTGCFHKAAPRGKEARTVAEVIPLTTANLRGHKVLYDQGWFVVSSTKNAFEYARTKGIKPSSGNLRRIAEDVVKRSGTLKSDVGGHWAASYNQAEQLLKNGTAGTGRIFTGTGELVAAEFDYATESFVNAYERFVYGNISLVTRTEQDFNQLKHLPGQYFKNLKNDCSNINEISSGVSRMVSDKIGLSWEDAFKRAAADFRDEYEQSGTRKNSLAALGDILHGYLKAFYGGLARPAAKSLVEYGAKGGAYGIFLPGAVVTVISGRTIEATGLTVVYASKMGYHVITPTVEAGFMSGLAVLSLAATPVTGVGGAGLAVVNQVAFTSVAPAYGVGRGVAETAIESGKYVALVAYDVAERNSRVMINYLSTGVVLGYNALTAIPVHLILGAADAAVFLAWDGPRLVVAVASGQVTDEKGEGSFSLGQLPTGSVVDLEKLKKQEGITVDIVTDDPDVIDRIFEKMPEDMGENHEH